MPVYLIPNYAVKGVAILNELYDSALEDGIYHFTFY